MYEFLGKKLNISEEKLKEFEHFMYGPLTDNEVIVYFQMDYGFSQMRNRSGLHSIPMSK